MGKILQVIVFALAIIFILPLGSSQYVFDDASFTIGTFAQNENITIRQVCALCNFNNVTSIYSPSGEKLLNNTAMTQEGGEFTLQFNDTQELGRYMVTGVGDLEAPGENVVWGYNFEITRSGEAINTSNAIIIFIATGFFFLIGAFFFVYSLREFNFPVKTTMIMATFMSFLAGLSLISVVIADSLISTNLVNFFDNFTAIAFILLYFLGALFIILWIITFFITIFQFKQNKKERRFG